MAPQKKDATGLIAGPLKVTARTDRKDRDKRIIFEAECVCGATEFFALAVLGQFQGHGLNCPGHPLKKCNEKPESGFTYFPDQPEYDAALAAWEAARHPGQIQEESEVNIAADTTTSEVMTTESASVENAEDEVTPTEPEATSLVERAPATEVAADAPTGNDTAAETTSDATPKTPVDTQETPKAVANKDTSTKMSAVLATRLKLHGYHTTSTKLLQPVKILGQDAVSVVFAANSEGDKVLLHVALVSADGKKSILSSKKKAPEADWSALSAALTGMNITWREKEQTRGAVAK